MEERSCGKRNWHGCNIKFGHYATTPKEHFRGTRIANRWNSCKPSARRSFFSPRCDQSGARKTKLSSISGLFNRTTAFAGSNRRSYILRVILPNFLGIGETWGSWCQSLGRSLEGLAIVGLRIEVQNFLKGTASLFKWAVRLESWLLQCLVISEDQWRRYKGTRICFGWVELLLSPSSATIDATRSKQLCDPNQSIRDIIFTWKLKKRLLCSEQPMISLRTTLFWTGVGSVLGGGFCQVCVTWY